MCTVTWCKEPGAIEIFFNRDELKTRLPALPPKRAEREGVAYLAPVDGNYGGTWIFANALGLSACLLNYYPEGSGPLSVRALSRGLLMTSLADCPDFSSIRNRLAPVDLTPYRPFLLLAFQPDLPVSLWKWDGANLAYEPDADQALPFTTSSYRSRQVEAARRETFHAMMWGGGAVTPENLLQFHQSHEPDRGAYSVCMQRKDAETQSLSRIGIGEGHVCFAYQRKIPGQPVFEEALEVVLPCAVRI